MPDQLQLRGGTTVQHSTFTGASKEVTVDTTKKTVVVHDGATAGGIPLLRQDGSNSALALGSVGTPSLKWDANTGIYSPGEDQVAVSTGGTARLYVGSTGLVGINTTSPQEKLEIQDGSISVGWSANTSQTNTLIAGYGYILSGTKYGNTSIRSTYNNANNLSSLEFYTSSSGAASAERARIDTSGRLLVGTSTGPSMSQGSVSRLVVQGIVSNNSDLGLLSLQRGETAANITAGEVLGRVSFNDSDGNWFGAIQCEADANAGSGDYPGRLIFLTAADGAPNPTERMTLDSLGNLLIGKTVTTFGTAGARFTNDGILQLTRDSDIQLATNRLTNDGTAVGFSRSGSQVGTISVTTTATAYNTSSDYRLKENVVPLSGAIDRVNDLQVRRFNFIADPDKTVDGFIAHEAQAVVPECVTGQKDAVDDDGNPVYQGIDQAKLVPLLTAALQEAIAKIETLEAKVTALETA